MARITCPQCKHWVEPRVIGIDEARRQMARHENAAHGVGASIYYLNADEQVVSHRYREGVTVATQDGATLFLSSEAAARIAKEWAHWTKPRRVSIAAVKRAIEKVRP